MPNRDGTGPQGQRSMSGRRQGFCAGGRGAGRILRTEETAPAEAFSGMGCGRAWRHGLDARMGRHRWRKSAV